MDLSGSNVDRTRLLACSANEERVFGARRAGRLSLRLGAWDWVLLPELLLPVPKPARSATPFLQQNGKMLQLIRSMILTVARPPVGGYAP